MWTNAFRRHQRADIRRRTGKLWFIVITISRIATASPRLTPPEGQLGSVGVVLSSCPMKDPRVPSDGKPASTTPLALKPCLASAGLRIKRCDGHRDSLEYAFDLYADTQVRNPPKRAPSTRDHCRIRHRYDSGFSFDRRVVSS